MTTRSSSRWWRAVWRITRSGWPCELCEVVGGADHRPFGRNGVDATQQELAEAAGLLDLSEHRFHDLLPHRCRLRHPARFNFRRIPWVNGPPIFRLTSAGCLARPVAM